MTKLEKMYKECCILQGRLAESTAKAKLCLSRLNDNPADHLAIEQEVEKLEKEMIGYFNLIQQLEVV